MKYIEEHTKLKLESVKHTETYIQKISSEIISNGRTKNQSLEKKIHVEINPKNTNSFNVTIKTEEYKLKLDSTLKKQEILSKEIASIMDVVKLEVNNKEGIIALKNHKQIKNKWETIRIRLENTFIGQAAERYFIGINKKINDYDKLLFDFKQYRLFGLMWNEIHQGYSNIKRKEKIHSIDNMLYNLPLAINEKTILGKQENNTICLNVTGELAEEQEYPRKIKNLLKRKFGEEEQGLQLEHYVGKYRFNTKTGILENLNLKIITAYGKVYKKTQKYQIIKEV